MFVCPFPTFFVFIFFFDSPRGLTGKNVIMIAWLWCIQIPFWQGHKYLFTFPERSNMGGYKKNLNFAEIIYYSLFFSLKYENAYLRKMSYMPDINTWHNSYICTPKIFSNINLCTVDIFNCVKFTFICRKFPVLVIWYSGNNERVQRML